MRGILFILFILQFAACSEQVSFNITSKSHSIIAKINRTFPSGNSGLSTNLTFSFTNHNLGDTVNIYGDAGCSATPLITHQVISNADTANLNLANFGLHRFYTLVGGSSSCQLIDTYSLLPPEISQINLAAPLSNPGGVNEIRVTLNGRVSGAGVTFYKDPLCHTQASSSFQGSTNSYRVNALDVGVNTIWARQTINGVSSACSQVSLAYSYHPYCMGSDFSATPFARGAGSSEDPYIICSLAQVLNMGTALDKSFLILENLDFSSVTVTPIASCFTGSIVGGDRVWSNLTMTAPLFTCFAGVLKNVIFDNLIITGGTQGALIQDLGQSGSNYTPRVENLELRNIEMRGTSHASGLARRSFNSTVKNIKVNGIIQSSGSTSVGGVIGAAVDSLLVDVSADVVLTAANASGVGGIAGSIENSFLAKASVTGSVSGDGQVGGVVGYSDVSTNYKISSFASLTGDWATAGLVGYLDGSKLSQCFTKGAVTGGYQSAAAVGVINNGEISNCYADSPTTQTNDNNFPSSFLGAQTGATNLLNANYFNNEQIAVAPSIRIGSGVNSVATNFFASASNFTDWNFTLVWQIDAGFPVFRQGRVASTFYFDPVLGLDSNNGTLAAPWKSIDLIGYEAMPGDTFILRGGTYPEGIEFFYSGTAGHPIKVEAYPFESPLLQVDFLLNQAAVKLSNVSYIELNGLEITALAPINTTTRTPIGIFVEGSSSHLKLDGLNIHSIANTHASGNAHGILIHGTKLKEASDITIENSKIHQMTLGLSEALSINGNVTNFKISNNEVHDNSNIGIDIIGYEGTCASCPEALDRPRDGVVSSNKVYNNSYSSVSAAGIYVDGGASILIEGNELYGNDFGIELAAEKLGAYFADDIIVRNNIIRGNKGAGIAIGGYTATRSGCRNCSIVHNTFFENEKNVGWSGQIYLQHQNQNVDFRNNIIVADSSNYMIYASADYNVNLDNNLYFNTGPLRFRNNGTVTTGLAQFQLLGQEINGVEGDPLFEDLISFIPSVSSPAKNSADAIDDDIVGTLDYLKNPRLFGVKTDRGAVESQMP